MKLFSCYSRPWTVCSSYFDQFFFKLIINISILTWVDQLLRIYSFWPAFSFYLFSRTVMSAMHANCKPLIFIFSHFVHKSTETLLLLLLYNRYDALPERFVRVCEVFFIVESFMPLWNWMHVKYIVAHKFNDQPRRHVPRRNVRRFTTRDTACTKWHVHMTILHFLCNAIPQVA